MNIFKKVLGLVLTVSMVSMNAGQKSPSEFIPTAGKALIAGVCLGVAAGANFANIGFATTDTIIGGTLIVSGFMFSTLALVEGSNSIINFYNDLSKKCKDNFRFSIAETIGIFLGIGLGVKALTDKDMFSPVKILWNGFKSITVTTNATDVLKATLENLVAKGSMTPEIAAKVTAVVVAGGTPEIAAKVAAVVVAGGASAAGSAVNTTLNSIA